MTISTVTTAMSEALARAARMVARWLPNERWALGGRRANLTATRDKRSAPTSVRLWPASASSPVEWAITPNPIWTTTNPALRARLMASLWVLSMADPSDQPTVVPGGPRWPWRAPVAIPVGASPVGLRLVAQPHHQVAGELLETGDVRRRQPALPLAGLARSGMVGYGPSALQTQPVDRLEGRCGRLLAKAVPPEQAPEGA